MTQLSLLDRYHQLAQNHTEQFSPILQALRQQITAEMQTGQCKVIDAPKMLHQTSNSMVSRGVNQLILSASN
jgi:predicted kinase